MIATRSGLAADMDAYERLLTAAMEDDATSFAREDYVEEAWRIVEPILGTGSPLYEYEPHSWGPREGERVTPAGGWHNPAMGQATPGAARTRLEVRHAIGMAADYGGLELKEGLRARPSVLP